MIIISFFFVFIKLHFYLTNEREDMEDKKELRDGSLTMKPIDHQRFDERKNE